MGISSSAEAGQADEVFGQVDDVDGLAHVQDEDFAASSHGGGLHDQLAGFGDGHEVALHFGVGYGYRPSPCIWSLKVGMTEPAEPRTFPKRTATNLVLEVWERAWM